MLKPVHPPWKLDREGRPKLDGRGNKIPNPKQDQPKKLSEYSEQEKKDYEYALRRDEDDKRRLAEAVLKPIRKAEEALQGS